MSNLKICAADPKTIVHFKTNRKGNFGDIRGKYSLFKYWIAFWRQLWSYNCLEKNVKLNEPRQLFMKICHYFRGNYKTMTLAVHYIWHSFRGNNKIIINCRQYAIQYLYLHLFTTNFAATLPSMIGKCPITQISNVKKARNREQPTDRSMTNWTEYKLKNMIFF